MGMEIAKSLSLVLFWLREGLPAVEEEWNSSSLHSSHLLPVNDRDSPATRAIRVSSFFPLVIHIPTYPTEKCEDAMDLEK